VISSWNGLVLTTLAESARATGNAEVLRAAQELSAFMLEKLTLTGRLLRSWRRGRARFSAQLADHAALGLGLLSLYQTDFDPRWFQAARTQAEEILSHFADPRGGFFDTGDDHEKLITRPKSIQDSPVASGNTLAVDLLLKLGALTGEAAFIEPAQSAARAMQAISAQHPTAFAGWLCAIEFGLGPQLQLGVIGDPGSPEFQDLIRVSRQRYLPRLVVAGGPSGRTGNPALLADRATVDGQSTAYLCQGFSCRLPTTSPKILEDQLNKAL